MHRWKKKITEACSAEGVLAIARQNYLQAYSVPATQILASAREHSL